jgi:hypothetical protein
MYASSFAVNGAITLKNRSHLARANSNGEQDNNIPVYKPLQLSMQKRPVGNAYFRRRTPGLRLKALSNVMTSPAPDAKQISAIK